MRVRYMISMILENPVISYIYTDVYIYIYLFGVNLMHVITVITVF